jgi:sigma-E factor negative regulatory protein RseA
MQQSRLSAMVDGELSEREVGVLLQGWRSQERLREDWHLYHLVGDVMRSDDLAQRPAADAQFLASFRERLASEPVVFAPTPTQVAEHNNWRRLAWQRARRWSAPAAVAAGVLSVTGVAVMTRSQWPGQSESAVMAVNTVAPVASAPLVASAQDKPSVLLRDPALDQYLAIHRQQSRTAAFAPVDGVRAVVMQPTGR